MLPRLLLIVALALLPAATAHADLKQPDGRTVPLDTKPLSDYFKTRTEVLNVRADALGGPGTFYPAEGAKLTLERHGGGQSFVLHWYDATFQGPRPQAADLHPLLTHAAGEPLGIVVNASAIRSDPAWAGGPVAFALVSDRGGRQYIHSYSVLAHNVVCTSCATPGPWIGALEYRSKATPGTGYLGFEDFERSATAFPADLDYDDALFRLEGFSTTACQDAVDNDADGVADAEDRGCHAAGYRPQGASETDPPLPAIELPLTTRGPEPITARITERGTGVGSCAIELDGAVLETAVTGDTCTAAVPAGLAPGDHRVRVRYRESFPGAPAVTAESVYVQPAPVVEPMVEPTVEPVLEPTPEPTPASTADPDSVAEPAPVLAAEPVAVLAAPAPLVLQCAGRVIDLVDVGVRGSQVRLFGLTLPANAGQRVTFTANPGRLEASAIVRSDGSFEALVPRPAARDAGRVRYTASLGAQRSSALKLSRRFVLDQQDGAAVSIRLTGRIAKGTRIEISRQDTCSRRTVVARRGVPAGGRLTLVLPPAPPGEIVTYRARTVGGKGRTFTLPIVVR